MNRDLITINSSEYRPAEVVFLPLSVRSSSPVRGPTQIIYYHLVFFVFCFFSPSEVRRVYVCLTLALAEAIPVLIRLLMFFLLEKI